MPTPLLQDPGLLKSQCLVDGRWCDALDGARFDVDAQVRAWSAECAQFRSDTFAARLYS